MGKFVWIVFNAFREIMGVYINENSADKLTEALNQSANDYEFYSEKYEIEN